MDTPSDIETGKFLGMILSYDYLMKNDYPDAADELAVAIEAGGGVQVYWYEDDEITVIKDLGSQETFKLTELAFA